MATQDKCCTIVPYFEVQSGKLEDFKVLCKRFVEKTNEEPKCLYYGFSFDGNQVHCREGYEDAEGVLSHLEKCGFSSGRSPEDFRPHSFGNSRTRRRIGKALEAPR